MLLRIKVWDGRNNVISQSPLPPTAVQPAFDIEKEHGKKINQACENPRKVTIPLESFPALSSPLSSPTLLYVVAHDTSKLFKRYYYGLHSHSEIRNRGSMYLFGKYGRV